MSNNERKEGRIVFKGRTEAIYKVIVIGDPTVGKTKLFSNFTTNQFEENYLPTVGVSILKEPIELSDYNAKVNLMFWDIAGQPQFYMLHRPYFNGADGMFLVFDITRSSTFSNINNWYSAAVKHGLSGIPRILIGNKAHLKGERKIILPMAAHLAEKLNAHYYETSTLSGENIKEAFEKIAELIYRAKGLGRPGGGKLIIKPYQGKTIEVPEKIQPPPKKKKIDSLVDPMWLWTLDHFSKFPRPSSYIPQTPGSYMPQTNISKKEKKKLAKEKKKQDKEKTKLEKERKIIEKREKHYDLYRVKMNKEAMGITVEIHELQPIEEEQPRLSDEDVMILDLESEEGIKFIKQYQEETNKFAIWRGKETKDFIKWLKGEKVETRDRKENDNFRSILENIELILKSSKTKEYFDFVLENLAKVLLRSSKNHYIDLDNFFEKIKKWEDYDEDKYPYSEILKLFSGDYFYRMNFILGKGKRKGRGDDRFPYPYVYKPPEPPDDLAVAPRVQLRSSPKKKDPEEIINCQYCGMELTKEEQLTHSCKMKPE